MDDVLKVAGIICRYILAVLACWWLFLFLALILQSSDRSHELAVMALGKAILCGALAAVWFRNARKEKGFQKLKEYTLKSREAAAQVQTKVPTPPIPSQEAQVIPSPNPMLESRPTEIEEPPRPEVAMSYRGRIFTGVAFAALAGIIIFTAISTQKSEPKPKNPIDDLFRPQTGQSQATDSVDQKLSDIWGSNAKGGGTNSSGASACPTALPSGVSSRPLNADDLSKIIGTDGKLTSEQSYDSYYAPNGTAWNATLSYSNKTKSCITVATVELELSYAGSVSKERHSIVFQPLLGAGGAQALSVGLRIKTPQRSEDVALLGWRTVNASGFALGSDAPTNGENGFQIPKDKKDPFVAPSARSARVPITAAVAVGLLQKKTVPNYPPIAKAARVSGTVVLRATISKSGAVRELVVVSGPAMLQQAALDAVKTWQYTPYTVDGRPVEVETTVNIVFTLGG